MLDDCHVPETASSDAAVVAPKQETKTRWHDSDQTAAAGRSRPLLSSVYTDLNDGLAGKISGRQRQWFIALSLAASASVYEVGQTHHHANSHRQNLCSVSLQCTLEDRSVVFLDAAQGGVVLQYFECFRLGLDCFKSHKMLTGII
jgi:hypothetical protein